jgi:hypothetical protein
MTEPTQNEIIRIVEQYRAALARRDAAALSRLTDAYQRLYGRLKDKIDLLVVELEKGPLTQGQLTRMARYKSLMSQIETELTDYQVILRNEISVVSSQAIANAGQDAAKLARILAGTSGVNVMWNRLPADAIKALLGFLSEDGPLYARIQQLAGVNAEKVAQAIIEGVGLGKGPREIAGLIRDSLGGGLSDALRMTRTVQLWSYRESTRANYLNNSDVVQGWIWYADLAGDPCMACIAQHGTIHGLDEILDDHYNGRCAMIPIVPGMDNPVEQGGEDWFSQLPEAKQRELMGPEKYIAWKGGAFDFSALAGKHNDSVYGDMTIETPLWELLGVEPPTRTQ